MPVLAEGAAEITARKTYREYLRAGPEMVEWLFLDWIYGKSGNESIEGECRFPVTVTPNLTLTAHTRRNKAAPGTELAP